MEVFLLVISMWGNDGKDWVFIGNQYINNNLMTKEQCEAIASDLSWSEYRENEYYDIQFDCFHKDEEIK